LRDVAPKLLIIKESACKPGSVEDNHSSAAAVTNGL